MIDYLLRNNLLPRLSSAYRRCHSTETALLKVFSDIVDAMDRGNFVLLFLLDQSAAFDTVENCIIRQRLSRSFGVQGSFRHTIFCLMSICIVTQLHFFSSSMPTIFYITLMRMTGIFTLSARRWKVLHLICVINC